jgi:hypothetical protein
LRRTPTVGENRDVGPLLVAFAIALGPAPPAVAPVTPTTPRVQGPHRPSTLPQSPTTAKPTTPTPPATPTTTEPTTPPPDPTHPPIELVWIAPPGCPSTTEVERQLAALLGDRDPGAPWVRVHAEVTTAGESFAMTLTTETSSGTTTHSLASPDCAALANAVALVAAVAADPMAVDRELDRAAALAAVEHEEPKPAPAKPVIVPPVEKRPRLRVARFALRADALLDYNVVPKVGFGPVITLGIFGPHWRTEVGAIYVAPRRVWIDDLATAGADISMWSLRVRGCGVPVAVAGKIEFPICAALEGGQLTGRPLGVGAPPEKDTHGWGAFSLGAGLSWAPRPFVALVLGVDLVVPFVHPRFVVPDGRDLHEVGKVGLRANLGIELRVP